MILFCKIDNKIEELSKTAQIGCKITPFRIEKPHFLKLVEKRIEDSTAKYW